MPGTAHHGARRSKVHQEKLAESYRYTTQFLCPSGVKRCAEDTDDTLLVVSLEVGKCTVKQMLVDAANILFRDMAVRWGSQKPKFDPTFYI